jgi:hypothetical protein
MNEEISTTIFISLTQRLELVCKKAREAKDEHVKEYWRQEVAKAREARRYIIEII